MGPCSVSRRPGPSGLEIWRLADEEASSMAELIPARGGLVSHFEVAGQKVLYLDPDTLTDLSKNVRGGIPILFPIAGALPEGRYDLEGRSYALGQHGFARNLPWKVVAERGGDVAEVECCLCATQLTHQVFPFPFEIGFTLTLKGRELSLSFRVANQGTKNLPLHFGLHPYFWVEEGLKDQMALRTKGTRVYDKQTGEVRDFSGLDFTGEEVELHLLNHGLAGTEISLPGRPPIELAYSSEFRMLVVWAQKGKDFVCVEPWTALTGAMSRGEGLLSVAPGTERTLNFRVAVAL